MVLRGTVRKVESWIQLQDGQVLSDVAVLAHAPLSDAGGLRRIAVKQEQVRTAPNGGVLMACIEDIYQRRYLHVACSITNARIVYAEWMMKIGDTDSNFHGAIALSWQLGGTSQVLESVAQLRETYQKKNRDYFTNIRKSVQTLAGRDHLERGGDRVVVLHQRRIGTKFGIVLGSRLVQRVALFTRLAHVGRGPPETVFLVGAKGVAMVRVLIHGANEHHGVLDGRGGAAGEFSLHPGR